MNRDKGMKGNADPCGESSAKTSWESATVQWESCSCRPCFTFSSTDSLTASECSLASYRTHCYPSSSGILRHMYAIVRSGREDRFRVNAVVHICPTPPQVTMWRVRWLPMLSFFSSSFFFLNKPDVYSSHFFPAALHVLWMTEMVSLAFFCPYTLKQLPY